MKIFCQKSKKNEIIRNNQLFLKILNGQQIMVTLGIGIPTINRADLLDEALQVYKNTFYGRHQIIIDNGNQDVKKYSFDQRVTTTPKNLGVSGSWNLIIELLRNKGYTHVAVLNDDVIWKREADEIEEFIQKNPADFYQGTGTWCCFVLPIKTFQTIGKFDEIFINGFFEDNSYAYRMKLAGMKTLVDPFFNPEVFRNSSTIAKNPKLNEFFEVNRKTYVEMWGGMPNQETFKTPFNGAREYDPNTFTDNKSFN
jgi:GT2 family glycosyltransferase